MHNFQDHVETHDISGVQFVVQTDQKELRVPDDSTITLKNQTATFLPLNVDFGNVRVKYATAQPLATLKTADGPHCVFVAAEGIPPEFALESHSARDVLSDDCQVRKADNCTYVHSTADRIAEFIVTNADGGRTTFAIIPKSMAVHAWLVGAEDDRRLIFSEATILPIGAAIEVHTRSPLISLTAYPKLPRPLHCDQAKASDSEPPHGSMSTHRIQLPEVDPFVHAKIADRRTVTLMSEVANLPAGVNDVFVEADYVGDVGMAFIEGQLVDDHFYYGQPWSIGLKRFLSKLQGSAMNLAFRPLHKDAPFLPDLPADSQPDFSKHAEILHVNSVRIVPEYRAVLNF